MLSAGEDGYRDEGIVPLTHFLDGGARTRSRRPSRSTRPAGCPHGLRAQRRRGRRAPAGAASAPRVRGRDLRAGAREPARLAETRSTRGSSEPSSMSGAACSPSGSRRRLCQQTSIPPRALRRCRWANRPRTARARIDAEPPGGEQVWLRPRLVRARRFGGHDHVELDPDPSGDPCPSSSEQLVTTPICTCSRKRPEHLRGLGPGLEAVSHSPEELGARLGPHADDPGRLRDGLDKRPVRPRSR